MCVFFFFFFFLALLLIIVLLAQLIFSLVRSTPAAEKIIPWEVDVRVRHTQQGSRGRGGGGENQHGWIRIKIMTIGGNYYCPMYLSISHAF